jgi:hypothetical protein
MNQTVVAPTTNAPPVVTIGANFEGSNPAGNPPDTDGAVGPHHFVEFLNDHYRVYDKSGAVLQEASAQQFWLAAGPYVAGSFDPRVVYDPGSGRWFAVAADLIAQPNNMLVAVSKTSDPTQGWQSILIPSDPTGQSWADFPRIGVDQDTVYLHADMFPLAAGGLHGEYFVLPKSDLLQATPTAANATAFADSFADPPAFVATPAVAYGSSGSEPFLSSDFTGSGILKVTSIDGPPTSPSLNISDRLVSIAPELPPPPARQKGTDVPIDTGPIGFEIGSDPVLHDGKLFAVQGIEQNGRAALRWFEIGDPLTSPVLLDSGIINPPNLDVYYGSIAVNPLGEAVIGFTGSGPDDYASAYAVAGTLNGNSLQFGDPILLKAGVAPYVAFSQRWGDYSATTYDPDNPTHFWTIQEWASGGTASGQGQEATEISEIIFAPPTPTVQTWFGGTGNFNDPQNWSPAGSPAATDTLVIDAGRLRADNLTITNPNIRLGSSTTTPTLILRDSTLAATSSIRVQTTTFDPSQPDLEARIRVVGAVTEDGAIDVGTTGIDVNQLFPAHLTISMARDSTFTMNPGAIWFSSDGSTLDVNGPERSAQFVNNGEVEAFGGTVRMNVPVTGQGTFDVLFDNNNVRSGTLEFAEDVGAGETVKLDAGLLKLDEPLNFLASIEDFNPDSTIELAHAKVTSADYSNGVLTLFDKHRVEARLNIVGDFTTEQFAIANHDGNAFITSNPSPPVSAEQSVNGVDGLNVDRQVAQLISAIATQPASNSGFNPMTMPTQTQNDSSLQSTLAPAWHS